MVRCIEFPKGLMENPHFQRVLAFMERRSAEDNSFVDLRRTCRNDDELSWVISLCITRVGSALTAEDEELLKTCALRLYNESVVDEVSGFYSHEPSPEEMAMISRLFFKQEPYLGYANVGYMLPYAKEITLETTFCADCEVPLEPNKQLSLFGEEE